MQGAYMYAFKFSDVFIECERTFLGLLMLSLYALYIQNMKTLIVCGL